MEIFLIVLKVIITIFVMLFMARLNGSKQIAQMSFYDYVAGITVGSIAASITLNPKLSFWHGILIIILFLCVSLLLNVIGNKSYVLRCIMVGKPITLIEQGHISKKGLKKARMSLHELLSYLRYSGYFNISEVETAVLETSGKVSVRPKENAHAVIRDDLHLPIRPVRSSTEVIMDGRILKQNLTAYHKSEAWLREEMKKQQINDLHTVFLAILYEDDQMDFYLL